MRHNYYLCGAAVLVYYVNIQHQEIKIVEACCKNEIQPYPQENTTQQTTEGKEAAEQTKTKM